MVNKLISAILTGIVFGFLIGITAAIPCMCIIGFVLMIALGAVTVHLAKDDIRDSMDAIVSSGIAGAVSGIVGAVVGTAGLAALDLVSKYDQSGVLTASELFGIGALGAFCCLPVLVFSGIMLSVIGGFVYYELAPKRNA